MRKSNNKNEATAQNHFAMTVVDATMLHKGERKKKEPEMTFTAANSIQLLQLQASWFIEE